MNRRAELLQELHRNNTTKFLDAALAYAAQGFPVFPCREGTRGNGKVKAPYVKGGFLAATKDPEQIKRWWRRWPEALIGMPTGPASGIVVLDVDTKNGVDGFGTLAALEHQYRGEDGLPARMRSVATPTPTKSGQGQRGRHLHFTADPGFLTTAGTLGAGLDTRGEGGYIILPPSEIPGVGVYAWENQDCPLTPPPGWMLRALGAKKLRVAGVDFSAVATAAEGTRNDTLNRAAFTAGRAVAAGVVQREEAEAGLRQAAAACGLPDDEAGGVVDRALDEGAATHPSERWKTDPLVEQYGPPYHERKNAKGQVTFKGLNEGYWAGHRAAENTILHEPAEKEFYQYDPLTGLFELKSSAVINQEVSRAILARSREDGVRALSEERTNNKLNSITSQLRGLVEQRDAFRKTENTIHLANAVLELRGMDAAVKGFDAKYRSRNRSPIPYTPGARCDRFLNELVLPAVNPEDVVILQKYFGLCLLARNLIQRFLILDGTPGGGKTQLAVALQHVVGLANCTQLRTSLLNTRFEIFRFLKKTLLVGIDVPADFLSTPGASVIKGLVGGDIFDAEQKAGTGCFPLEGNFLVVVTSNSRLRVRLEGDVGAWRRRLLVVRYEALPPKRKIPEFGKLLVQTEGAGILNWGLDGLRALMSDIEETGDIVLTERQSRTVDSLLSESDSLREFLKSRVTRQEGGSLTTQEIVAAYAEYCPTRGWAPLPITEIQRGLEGLMLELFHVPRSNSVARDKKDHKGFRGVAFGTLGTGIPNPRAIREKEETTTAPDTDTPPELIGLGEGVPSVPTGQTPGLVTFRKGTGFPPGTVLSVGIDADGNERREEAL